MVNIGRIGSKINEGNESKVSRVIERKRWYRQNKKNNKIKVSSVVPLRERRGILTFIQTVLSVQKYRSTTIGEVLKISIQTAK